MTAVCCMREAIVTRVAWWLLEGWGMKPLLNAAEARAAITQNSLVAAADVKRASRTALLKKGDIGIFVKETHVYYARHTFERAGYERVMV